MKSIYIKRQHEKTRLNSDFRKIFSTIINKQHLIDKISLDIPKLKNKILTNAEITQLDKEQNLQGGLLSIKLSPMDLQNRFDSFASEMSEPFAKVVSHGVIKRCIFQFFKDNTQIGDLMDMEMITLSSKNRDHFIKIISNAKEQFTRDIVEKIKREIEDIPKWNIPESTEYTKIYKEKDYKKCIMSPSYIKTDIENEIRFMDFLEEENNVK